jgi:hypothetical protein
MSVSTFKRNFDKNFKQVNSMVSRKDLNIFIANQKMRASDVYEEIGLKIYRVLFKLQKQIWNHSKQSQINI